MGPVGFMLPEIDDRVAGHVMPVARAVGWRRRPQKQPGKMMWGNDGNEGIFGMFGSCCSFAGKRQREGREKEKRKRELER